MEPRDFKGRNVVVGEHQPGVQPLPAYMDDFSTLSCWRMTWRERLAVLLTGEVWVAVANQGQPLQPLMVAVRPVVAQLKPKGEPDAEQ